MDWETDSPAVNTCSTEVMQYGILHSTGMAVICVCLPT